MAHIPRLYVQDDLHANAQVKLDDNQSKYLLRVMRLDQGAEVRAFNGRDGEWRCDLVVAGKRARLQPVEQTHEQVLPPDLTLLFAPLKKTRTDFVVEKASELGVRTIQPVITHFTQSERVRSDRLQALCVEAAEQTERLDVPIVQEAEPLARAIADWDKARPLYFCDESGQAPPMQQCLQQRSESSAGLLIGPEGGFSTAEGEMLRAHEFVIPVSLGPRILRAETAAVCALTLWQSVLGDWR